MVQVGGERCGSYTLLLTTTTTTLREESCSIQASSALSILFYFPANHLNFLLHCSAVQMCRLLYNLTCLSWIILFTFSHSRRELWRVEKSICFQAWYVRTYLVLGSGVYAQAMCCMGKRVEFNKLAFAHTSPFPAHEVVSLGKGRRGESFWRRKQGYHHTNRRLENLPRYFLRFILSSLSFLALHFKVTWAQTKERREKEKSQLCQRPHNRASERRTCLLFSISPDPK